MILNLLTQSKISQFENFVVNKNIVRFYVTMNQLSIVQHLISSAYLLHYLPYFVLRHQCHLRYQDLKRSLVAILHYYVEVVRAQNLSLDAVDYILVMWQLVQHLKLCLNRLLVISLEEGDDFDNKLLTRLFLVVDPIDFAIGSFSQFLILSNKKRSSLQTLPPYGSSPHLIFIITHHKTITTHNIKTLPSIVKELFSADLFNDCNK